MLWEGHFLDHHRGPDAIILVEGLPSSPYKSSFYAADMPTLRDNLESEPEILCTLIRICFFIILLRLLRYLPVAMLPRCLLLTLTSCTKGALPTLGLKEPSWTPITSCQSESG